MAKARHDRRAMAPAPADTELLDEGDVNAHLRTVMKQRSSQANSADFALSVTLGAGTFGRVRLAQSVVLADKSSEEGKVVDGLHSGYFAVKILKKSEIIRLKQTEHVKSERDLLFKMNHPFIVTLHGCYKDERNLFMVLEYVPGGEVLAECRRDLGKLDNDVAKFYAAQLVMALQHLHSDNIIFRGMVPDNLLVDKTGYLKLVDFGFAKRLGLNQIAGDGSLENTFTLCGTAEYLAPEIVNSKGHGKGADWWALGVVIYEMLAGYPPFYANSPFEIYNQILKATPVYPSHFDINLYEGINRETGLPVMQGSGKSGEGVQTQAPRTGLLARLLQLEIKKRIGCLKNGAEDIKKHKWFRGLNWAALYNKQMPPPLGVPELKGDDDHDHFPTYPDSVEESGPFLEPAKQQLFDFWGC